MSTFIISTYAVYCFEQILEATLYKTAVIQQFYKPS